MHCLHCITSYSPTRLPGFPSHFISMAHPPHYGLREVYKINWSCCYRTVGNYKSYFSGWCKDTKEDLAISLKLETELSPAFLASRTVRPCNSEAWSIVAWLKNTSEPRPHTSGFKGLELWRVGLLPSVTTNCISVEICHVHKYQHSSCADSPWTSMLKCKNREDG